VRCRKERVCECEVSMYLGGFSSVTALLLKQVVLQTQLVEIWYRKGERGTGERNGVQVSLKKCSK
jgi:hypothetical protein